MQNNLLDYTGKVALITGAATGIGRATAIAFAEQGVRVVIGDVSDEAADTVAELKKLGCEALYVRTDVSDPASVQAPVQATVTQFARLDCAFANAGMESVGCNDNVELSRVGVLERHLHIACVFGKQGDCVAKDVIACRSRQIIQDYCEVTSKNVDLATGKSSRNNTDLASLSVDDDSVLIRHICPLDGIEDAHLVQDGVVDRTLEIDRLTAASNAVGFLDNRDLKSISV